MKNIIEHEISQITKAFWMIMELEETLIKWICSTSQAKRKSSLLWRIC